MKFKLLLDVKNVEDRLLSYGERIIICNAY